MKENIKQILFYSIVIFFVLILSLTTLSFYFVDNQNVPVYLQIFVDYHVIFMFIIAILGIFFGSFIQIMSERKIERNEKKLETMQEFFLESLSNENKKIIIYLIKNNGVSNQYELTKLENLTKLKVSRALEDLEKKGLVRKEKIGKINKVFLTDKLKEVYI